MPDIYEQVNPPGKNLGQVIDPLITANRSTIASLSEPAVTLRTEITAEPGEIVADTPKITAEVQSNQLKQLLAQIKSA